MPIYNRLILFFLLLSPYLSAQTEYLIEGTQSQIYFKTFGEGIPILIINGGPGMNSEGFASLALELSDQNMTILYDQRGTGKSMLDKISSSTITMKLMANDIEIIRDHLGIDKWIVLGHSFGGMMASYYASKYSDHTLGLVLSSSGGLDLELLQTLNIQARLSQIERDSLNYWSNQIQRGDTSYSARLKRGMYLAPAYLYAKEFVPLVAHRLTQGNLTINGLVFRDLQRIRYDVKDELRSYDKPVLIIQGAHDIIPIEISETAHSVFSDSQLIILKNSGHYGWLEEKEVYFKAVREFLTKTS